MPELLPVSSDGGIFLKPASSKSQAYGPFFYRAERLLGTGAASTCFLERRHSNAGYIMSKRRARLKSSTAENLTLAFFMLRDKAQTEAAGVEFTGRAGGGDRGGGVR